MSVVDSFQNNELKLFYKNSLPWISGLVQATREFVCMNWESISEAVAVSFYAQKISTRYQVHLQLIHLSLHCWLTLFVWASSHFHFPQFWLMLLPLFL